MLDGRKAKDINAVCGPVSSSKLGRLLRTAGFTR